jgi:hypothetical protein
VSAGYVPEQPRLPHSLLVSRIANTSAKCIKVRELSFFLFLPNLP